MTGDGDAPSARVVAVGISQYDHYPQLPIAAEEVEELGGLLAERNIRVEVLDPGDEHDILRQLDDALRPAQDGAAQVPLLVLWVGHGDTADDSSLRLIARNSEKGRPARLKPQDVATCAAMSGATQILLIFDTCYSGGGAIPALVSAEAILRAHEQIAPLGRVWIGVLASAMDWEKARDDLFGEFLVRLLRDGPSSAEQRLRWSAHNAGVRGDDLIDAIQKEWDPASPHRPKAVQYGDAWTLLPNPLYDPGARPRVVEHLLTAARGGEPSDEAWYFSGRHDLINQLSQSVTSGEAGLEILTGPAGCGKSAVLGFLGCLSDADQRARLPDELRSQYADPGECSVHAQIHARGLTATQMTKELDLRLSDAGLLDADRRGRRGPGELIDAIVSSEKQPVVLVDGLDEAGAEAWRIADTLLRPIGRHARVVVGTRDLPGKPGEPSLLESLEQYDGTVRNLLDGVDDDRDVGQYIRRRLAGVNPQMDPDLVAEAVLSLPRPVDEGLFLLARILTEQLRKAPVNTSEPGWEQQLSTTVEAAFESDLRLLPPRYRDEREFDRAGIELLGCLAWAQGSGFPDDLWPVAASAVSSEGTDYTRDDCFWALQEGGRYIVEAGEAGHAAYRLSHQRLAEYLRHRVAGGRSQEVNSRVAEKLVDSYLAWLTGGGTPSGHPYLWSYTWRHCADAGNDGITQFTRLVALDEPTFLPYMAAVHRYQSFEHARSGDYAAALQSAEQATEVYAEVVKANPEYQPDLAEALDNLGNGYRAGGDFDAALSVSQQAVTMYRGLQDGSAISRADLAAALNNLGNRYMDLNDPTSAVAALEESLGDYRKVVEADRGFEPPEAMVLINLGNAYRAADRPKEALDAVREAVRIYREWSVDDPEYEPDLAYALCILNNHDLEFGHYEESVPPIEEAVRIYRQICASDSGFRPHLAFALDDLGASYSASGRRTEAISSTEEAVGILRELAAEDDRFGTDLARVTASLEDRR